MKRNLLLLNLALLVLVSFLGWYLRKRWIESRDHEHKVLTAAVRPAPVAPPPPPAPKPMPPLPAAHGVMMWDGVPPTVVLSERGRPGQKSYHPGDTIGQFTIVSVSNKEVVFNWEGKEVSARLDDMMQKGLMNSSNNNPAPNPPGQPQGEGTTTKPGTPLPNTLINPSAQAPAQASQVTSLTSNDPSSNQGSSLGPGAEVPGQGIRTCVAGDSSPPGTVVNGLQKKVNTTPFGVVCRWEPAK